MITQKLAAFLGTGLAAAPSERLAEFAALHSQTCLQERESLYAVTRFAFTGEGDVWDVGCAAGGSSYCLGAGVADSALPDKAGRVQCFDLFNGYSQQAFAPFSHVGDDLEIFHRQTAPVAHTLVPRKMNLLTDLAGFQTSRPIEIAHLDAAKSLDLWKAIFCKMSGLIIPGKTIWVYQDFERVRLIWQLYTLVPLLEHAEIVGDADYGTIYLKFCKPIAPDTITKILCDDFGFDERIENINLIMDLMAREHLEIFAGRAEDVEDLRTAATAYCYYWTGQRGMARNRFMETSARFRNNATSRIYRRELLGSSATT